MRHRARHLGEGKRGGVRGDDAGVGDDGLKFGEHLLLDGHVLEDGLNHETRIGEPVLRGAAADKRAEPVGHVGLHPALVDLLHKLPSDELEALVDPVLIEVGHDDGNLKPLSEQERELAGHESGANDAHLGDGASERTIRRADW